MFEITIAILVGAMGWSFTEYCVHRWLGHDRRFIKNFFGEEHTAHHSKGNYFSPAWKKALAALASVSILIGPAVFIAGPRFGTSFVLGFVGFYLYYEWYHRSDHISAGWGAYGRYMRRHHFFHHFHDPNANFGVTSPIWDVAFGTFQKVGVVRVPEKLQMRWLCDPKTGDVWQNLKPHYELRRLNVTVCVPENPIAPPPSTVTVEQAA
jgi:sterol desaturase/sphingolipid hydroxylase (fatty acid hydroxylase superfamily)